MAQQIVIDTDVGTDDVSAILMCLAHSNYAANAPSDSFKVTALTIVDGNVSLPAAYQAAKTVMAVAGIPHSEVPVIAGAEGPLVPGLLEKVCYEGHGTDGLGNFTTTKEYTSFLSTHLPTYTPPPLDRTLHAATELVRLAAASPGTLTILAIGPLTNLAIALALDPHFLGNVKQVYMMGGSIYAKGNSSRTAEFNFHIDPESAHVVFHAASLLPDIKLTLVPWETTVSHALPWTFIDFLLSRGEERRVQSKYAEFLQGYLKTEEASRRPSSNGVIDDAEPHQEYYDGLNMVLQCDVYAAACIIDPTSILQYKDMDIKIELGGTYSRGQSTINWFANSKPNCRVVSTMDMDKIKKMYEMTFR
ncbi:hypothetical protein HDU98_010048 [Podochytrium sp. JEL0797]|nr:hypothetical protein HDU98_010048 [Podochytrium sp. JEL0797]